MSKAVTDRTKKPNRNKIRYECESCGQKCWGKPQLLIVCGLCNPGVLQHIDKLQKLEAEK